MKNQAVRNDGNKNNNQGTDTWLGNNNDITTKLVRYVASSLIKQLKVSLSI